MCKILSSESYLLWQQKFWDSSLCLVWRQQLPHSHNFRSWVGAFYTSGLHPPISEPRDLAVKICLFSYHSFKWANHFLYSVSYCLLITRTTVWRLFTFLFANTGNFLDGILFLHIFWAPYFILTWWWWEVLHFIQIIY